jgi:hypothetical protein
MGVEGLMSGTRSARIIVGLAVLFALALMAPPSGAVAAGTRPRGPVYFWANLGGAVKSPVHGSRNPFVVRPSTLILFEDGQWIIEKLHWKDWGSPVARATGKSSSSDDDPNAAEGKRIITWAKVTLYDMGTFEGRRVYRCIRIEVPPPAHWGSESGTGCLQRIGNSVLLLPPGTGTPVGIERPKKRVRHIDDFFAFDRLVWCQISRVTGASCGTDPAPPTHSASLDENGNVEICTVEKLEYPGGPGQPPLGCFQNWPLPSDHIPVLREGEATTVAGITCTSEPMHVTCVKTSGRGKGKGFAINADLAADLIGT